MIMVALAHCRVDYGNAVLVGLPAYLQHPPQLVNMVAQLTGFCDCITDAL